MLLVDDEEAILKQFQWAFKNDFKVITAQTAEEAIGALKTKSPELMILDLSLTGDPANLEGFRILESALQIDPALKVIVITGHDDKENALTAIERGALDFYTKPVAIDELRTILRRASYIRSLESEISRLKKKGHRGREFEGIIATSEAMLEIFETVKKVAPTDVSVLITGESGTGKELIARAIHKISPRQNKAFIPINCGAIPENLLESELFGHEKGSFTGAHASRPGKFEVADGGTLFLDEIGELPPSLQVKILRFLQDQVIERVGGREPIQLDVRIIAATNRDLASMLEDRSFREDLYYRINTISIPLPPLQQRHDDILLLSTHFLHHYNREYSRNVRGFSQAALETLYNYSWPGNVRELENRVKRGVIMSRGKMIQPPDMDLPSPAEGAEERFAGAEGKAGASVPTAGITLKEAREGMENRLLNNALLRHSGNVSAAAQELGVSRPTLHDLMKKHQIDPEDFRAPKNKK
ncbi:MAG: PEP-CTERM-box response regulator transcription factor [Candidatus Krumholzibacteriota bacterium]|nr:PEP-CTERM-box response regulator transcription factor [Candidatus Krumholzibacteriota bacterium]